MQKSITGIFIRLETATQPGDVVTFGPLDEGDQKN